MPSRGRKPIELENPFWESYDGEDDRNMLEHDEIASNISLEDIIRGCIRACNEDEPSATRAYVQYRRVIDIYRDVQKISFNSIKEYLNCSDKQARRYFKVIKVSGIFIPKLLENIDKLPRGYKDG